MQSKPVAEIVAAIQQLDLDPIKVKLMDAEEGQGWSREYVDLMEVEYKRFLILGVKHPGETIVPSKDIDKFWHGHILDTLKYAEDCENVFGYFLHHFPYFGMRGEEDAANLAAAGDATARLYAQEFGQPRPTREAMCGAAAPVNVAAMCGASTPAMCGAAVRNETAAMCGAAAPEKVAAMCGATKPAMCGATKPAMCGAAVSANAAMCGAAKPSMCGATIKLGSGLNTSVRPKLEQLAA